MFAWCIALSVAAVAPLLGQSTNSEERFQRLMKDILIVDTHIDTPRYVIDEGYKFGIENDYRETDIPRLRRGHVGGIFFGLMATPRDYPPQLWVPRTLNLIDGVHELARRYPKDLAVAYTSDDIRRIHKEGRIATLLSVEGGHQIQDDLRILRDYYRLGVRYMTLTHFKTNNWADSSTDEAVHDGLSPYGREIVREMNRVGMMVDISHVSDKAFYDVLEVSSAPVMASHSSVRVICNTPRNMTDDMIKVLAEHGGVIFINFSVAYLDQKAWEIFSAYQDERNREIADVMLLHKDDPKRFELRRAIQQRYRRRLPKVGYQKLLEHIDHVVKLVGAAHVGIGSDFDGISGMVPAGVEDVSKFPVLVRGMIEMGYSDEDIRKIMGENLMRIMKRAEAVSREMARQPR